MQNRTIAHDWWYNTDPGARKIGSNFFWCGNSIYSYGEHHKIARKYAGQIALLNNKHVSSSTARHTSYVVQAMPPGWQMFEVANVDAQTLTEHKGNRNALLQQIVAIMAAVGYDPEKVSRPGRRKLLHLIPDYRHFCAAFHVESLPTILPKPSEKLWRKKLLSNAGLRSAYPLLELSEMLEAIEERHQERRAFLAENPDPQAEAKRLKRQQAKAKAFESKIQEWREYKRANIDREDMARLRLSKSGKQVETSKGSVITIKEFKLGLTWLKRFDKTKKRDNDMIADKYVIGEITDDMVAVGCHRIPRSEIAYICSALKHVGTE
jgi:hypothetical protein